MEVMESWRRVWRAAAPLLPTRGLEALRTALLRDDPALIQGATTSPPPCYALEKFPVEAACLLGYCGWKGDDLKTVGETEEFFARTCFATDERLEEPAGVRWLLNWWDESPREEVLPKLLAEVNRELARRAIQKGEPG
jgi:hypothetical protein